MGRPRLKGEPTDLLKHSLHFNTDLWFAERLLHGARGCDIYYSHKGIDLIPMGAVGVILVATDGLIVGTDTPVSRGGDGNQSIFRLSNQTACFVYSDEASHTLASYIAAVNPLPVTPSEFVQSIGTFLRAHPAENSMGAGLAVAGVESPERIVVHEILWKGTEVKERAFPGNLMIGQHSIPRYLADRIYSRNLSLDSALEQVSFIITETRLALPNLQPHVAMATIGQTQGFGWVEEPLIAALLERARKRSQQLTLGCVGLF